MKKLMQNKELLVGVIFLVVGIAYFALAFTIPSYDAYGGSSVVDSSFVPKVVGILMIVLSVMQLLIASKSSKNAPTVEASAKPEETAEEGGEFKVEDWDDDAANRNADTKALVAIFLILIVYMALMSVLGFMISSALFLFATMMLLTPKQKRKLPIIIILSVVVAVSVCYLFVYGLDMVLPTGMIG